MDFRHTNSPKLTFRMHVLCLVRKRVDKRFCEAGMNNRITCQQDINAK